MREYDMRIRGWSSDVCSSDLLVNIIDVICLRAEDRSSDGLEYGRDDHSIIPVSRFTGHIVCHIPVCVLPGVDSGFDSAFGYAGSDIVRIVLQCALQASSGRKLGIRLVCKSALPFFMLVARKVIKLIELVVYSVPRVILGSYLGLRR